MVQDLQRTIDVLESRSERRFTEQQQNYEKEIQFLMQQLAKTEEDVTNKDLNKYVECKFYVLCDM